MLQAWLSIGYIVLLAILVLAFILWRRGAPILAIAALVVGIPLWFGWEYVRPTWTTGVITGTEVRRSDPDARGNTTDIEYIYMRNRFDRGLELINDDSWWWLKRNSERVFPASERHSRYKFPRRTKTCDDLGGWSFFFMWSSVVEDLVDRLIP